MSNTAIAVKPTTITIPDPGQALRPLHEQTKLTRKKKIELLTVLGKNFNLSKAANKVGIHRKSVEYLLKNDKMFAQAYQEVKDAWLDQIEDSGLTVAIQPTRDSFNHAKLFLTAHRPELYNTGPQVQINQAFISDNPVSDTRTMLKSILPNDTSEE